MLQTYPTERQNVLRGLTVTLLTALSVLPAQQIDRIIPVSDTVAGGATVSPGMLALSPASDRLYCVGEYGWAAVLDCASNGVTKDIPVPAYEEDCPSTGPVSSSVNNKTYIPTTPGITIVDGTTDSVIATLRIPRGQGGCYWAAWGMAYNDSGNCLVAADPDSNRLLVIDGTGDTVRARLAVTRQPFPVAWNSRNNRYYVLHSLPPGNDSWHLTVFDARADTVLDSFPLLVSDLYVALQYVPTVNKLYIGFGGSLVVIDCGPDTVCRRLPFGGYDLVWSSVTDKLYCLDPSGDSIKVVDCNGDTLLRTIRVVPQRGWRPRVAYGPSVNKLFVVGDSVVGIIDCGTDSLVAELPIASFHIHGVVWSELLRCAYVIAFRNEVVTIDGVSNQVRSRASTGIEKKHGFIWNPSVGKLYVRSLRGGDTGIPDLAEIVVIDGETGRFVKRLPAGYTWNTDNRLCLGPTGTKIYCPNSADGTISVIDCTSDSVVKTISTAPWPFGLSVNPEDNRLYCTHCPDPPGASLSVIDCRADSVIANVELPGNGATYPVWFAGVRKVYVQYMWSNIISVVDGATNRLLTSISGFPDWLSTPAVCDHGHKRLYVTVVNWRVGPPVLFSVDAVADTILKSFTHPELANATSAVLNPGSDKLYFEASHGPDWRYAIGVYDCALGKLLNPIVPPSRTYPYGQRGEAFPVSHPSVSRVYFPFRGDYHSDGRTTNGGVAVIDCNLDSIVAMARYPIPDWLGTEAHLDPNTGLIYVDGISRIYVVRDGPPGLNGPVLSGDRGVSFSCFPNPMERCLTVRASGKLTDPAVLRIFDRSGRQVRSLVAQSRLNGCAVWRWEGRDELGHEVPAGVYFLSLRAAPSTASVRDGSTRVAASTKIVKLR